MTPSLCPARSRSGWKNSEARRVASGRARVLHCRGRRGWRRGPLHPAWSFDDDELILSGRPDESGRRPRLEIRRARRRACPVWSPFSVRPTGRRGQRQASRSGRPCRADVHVGRRTVAERDLDAELRPVSTRFGSMNRSTTGALNAFQDDRERVLVAPPGEVH